MYVEKTFTPQQLFKMVWERPVLIIAKEIGVSDVGLSKACRKAGITLPTRPLGQASPETPASSKASSLYHAYHFSRSECREGCQAEARECGQKP